MVRTMKTASRFEVVTPRVEEILKTVHFYRYVTALDIAHLLYSSRILTYVRRQLTVLAGGDDFIANQFLYRICLPTPKGNKPRVFTLGSRGRAYLKSELGLPTNWYFRPDKVKNMGYSQMLHNVILTRFLVASHAWCANHPDFRLSQIRMCYELVERPSTVIFAHGGRRRVLKVVPDAWLLFQRLSDGKRFPILLEIDRGTQFQNKFREHVRSRIEYLRSGLYERTFGTKAVLIAYATTGAKPEYAQTRRSTLCAWTLEFLEALGMREWASIFRFHALSLDDMYAGSFLDEPVWYRPDSSSPCVIFP
jgi:hypothetical protein